MLGSIDQSRLAKAVSLLELSYIVQSYLPVLVRVNVNAHPPREDQEETVAFLALCVDPLLDAVGAEGQQTAERLKLRGVFEVFEKPQVLFSVYTDEVAQLGEV